MAAKESLPLPKEFASTDEYVKSLLKFATGNKLLNVLCGGVHILDFFTRTPDVYESVFPEAWRRYFGEHEIKSVLDLLLREDVDALIREGPLQRSAGSSSPPLDLLEYIREVRKHCLDRDFRPERAPPPRIARHVAVGMKVKKIHEVSNFAGFINGLVGTVRSAQGKAVTHLVDIGAGQNYLGRTLSSEPYNRQVIAIEGRAHNIEGARDKDVIANLSKKPVVYRNKKEFREGAVISKSDFKKARKKVHNLESLAADGVADAEDAREPLEGDSKLCDEQADGRPGASLDQACTVQRDGNVTYVGYKIQDGDLTCVTERVFDSKRLDEDKLSLLTLSLHSCGNLIHHGLRTILNPDVCAVALVGCCYNLMTERLGPQSFKFPSLQTFYRSKHPRVEEASSAKDPHGFPMSRRLCEYQPDADVAPGVRFNITARSMAVQAPSNWGPEDSEGFFTRHFYRALLQRIFVDLGVLSASSDLGDGGGTAPVIIGNLAKACYTSFVAYVRGAVRKLTGPTSPSPNYAAVVASRLNPEVLTDDAILDYERRFIARKHDLAVAWSMMAFSACIVESVIVVDRWLWLSEQEVIESAWVETVFDYKESPRNLVVVGIKKAEYCGAVLGEE